MQFRVEELAMFVGLTGPGFCKSLVNNKKKDEQGFSRLITCAEVVHTALLKWVLPVSIYMLFTSAGQAGGSRSV